MTYSWRILVCLLILLGCNGHSTAPVTKAATIMGQITCGGPVAGASVSTIPSTSVVKTDSSGKYVLSNVPLGQCVVQVSNPNNCTTYEFPTRTICDTTISYDTIAVVAGEVDTVNESIPCMHVVYH